MTIEEALQRALDLGEVGVQVAAYLGDELVIDAWAGEMAPGRSVSGETLFNIFSVTKAVSFTLLHIQVERGLVDYDAPVARYWPAFGVNGKDRILVRHLLEHRSGAPQMPPGCTFDRMTDWDWMAKHIAALERLAPAGEMSSYNSFNVGWTVGEIIRRTDPLGRPINEFLQQELCQPLGIPDLWMGLPAQVEDRVATLTGDYVIGSPMAARPLWTAAMGEGMDPTPEAYNRPEMRAACIPAAGGIATARSQARFWALWANRGAISGVRLFPEGKVWALQQERERPGEYDAVLGAPLRQTVGGFRLSVGEYPRADAAMGHRPWAVMHNGAGGSIGWADLEERLAVAICHNRMFDNFPPRPLEEHPFAAIGQAIRELVGARQR